MTVWWHIMGSYMAGKLDMKVTFLFNSKIPLGCTLGHSSKSQGIMHILNFPQELDNKQKKAHPLKIFDVKFAPQIRTGSPIFVRGDVTSTFSQLFKNEIGPSKINFIFN